MAVNCSLLEIDREVCDPETAIETSVAGMVS